MEEEARTGAAAALQAYGHSLDIVLSLKYIGGVLTASDDDWLEVVYNLRKVRKKWDRMSRILCGEGSDARTSGTFYKVAVQAILLFGSEIWFMTPWIGRTLGGFHHRVDLRLEGMQFKRDTEVRWEYRPLELAMASVGLDEVDTYVLRHQNTISRYIVNFPILELCLEL